MRPIAISLSPNTETDDVILAIKTLFSPWTWNASDSLNRVIEWFSDYFGNSQLLLYNSGRSAEYEILRAMGIGKGDDVIVQAFTCAAVPNSILWTGANVVYADIDQSLNLTVESCERVLTKKTKAIIVQHTLGVPAEIDRLVIFARKNNLLLIEDCAHSLGATYKNQSLGSWGDAAFFSFGRDKVVSSVFGGAAMISKEHKEIFKALQNQYRLLPSPSVFWTTQQLFHPIAFAVILPLYQSGIGKVLLYVLQKLHLLSFPVYPEEKLGKNPGIFPSLYPNALAALVLLQLKKLNRYNTRRQEIVSLYKTAFQKSKLEFQEDRNGAIYLRYSFFIEHAEQLLQSFRKKGILLGNWYRTPVDPRGTILSAVQYKEGLCKNAERLSSKVINLPTLISTQNAQRIVSMIQSENL